jgi:hypothetical protein
MTVEKDEEKFRGMTKVEGTWRKPLRIILKIGGIALCIPLTLFVIYRNAVILIVFASFIITVLFCLFFWALPRYCPKCGKEMKREKFIEEGCEAEVCVSCNIYSEKVHFGDASGF